MGASNAVVAIYESRGDAETAVMELQKAGFDMKKLSIVGRDPLSDEEEVVGYFDEEEVVGYIDEEEVVGYFNQLVGYDNTGERMKSWGKLGAIWGGIWGLLCGWASFFIPRIGPVLIAGPLARIIVTPLEGAVVLGGVSAIGAGLYSLAIPTNSALDYEIALRTDKFLLVAHGSTEEVTRAKGILSTPSWQTSVLHLK